MRRLDEFGFGDSQFDDFAEYKVTMFSFVRNYHDGRLNSEIIIWDQEAYNCCGFVTKD